MLLMKNWKNTIMKDIWVILLDLVVVNASYYLALLVRFYVNNQLRPIALSTYLPAWMTFTPFYTVISIAIFFAFRLYGGMWRYAGINDMNRLILANVCTTVIHVVGTAVFLVRMPYTYYIIGSILQFVLVACIRFGYRVFVVEKKKIRSKGLARIDCFVVGSGENGRRVVKNLEETEYYHPIAVVGTGSGIMDGIPIIGLDSVEWKKMKAVFIADPLLSFAHREEIRKRANEEGIELHDYTGYFSNLGGNLSLTEILSIIHTPVMIELDGKERQFKDGEAVLEALTGKYSVDEIEAKKIRISHGKKTNMQDALIQAYELMIGEEPLQGGSK